MFGKFIVHKIFTVLFGEGYWLYIIIPAGIIYVIYLLCTYEKTQSNEVKESSNVLRNMSRKPNDKKNNKKQCWIWLAIGIIIIAFFLLY